ncbi:MAG: hypothetical protein ACRD4Q_00215 [Candidatus Acidiferrales bacterium]
MSDARKYPLSDVKLLWGLAAARCGYPGCRVECVEQATEQDRAIALGKIAHIVPHKNKPGEPRYDPAFPNKLIDRYENWILLCARDHDIVDGQPNTYTAPDLRRWKSEHEQWARERLAAEMPEVGFAELEMVTKAIAALPLSDEVQFTLTAPREKMRRNGLSDQVNMYVMMGFSKVREVAAFVNHIAVMSGDFPEQLKAGFVKRYREARSQGIEGDALFETLHEFASGGRHDFRHQAAGLAVLMYLFESCEVFEP